MSATRAVVVPSVFQSSQRAAPGERAVARDLAHAEVDTVDRPRAGGRAVALPELKASSGIGEEEQQPVGARQLEGARPIRPRDDIFDAHGAGGRAVALPQLHAAAAVVGGEVERVAQRRQPGRVRAERVEADVLDAHGTGGRAIALPQLAVVVEAAVAGAEEQRPVQFNHRVRVGALRAGVDIPDQPRPSSGAIARPELDAAVAVVGPKIERRANDDRLGWSRVGVRVRLRVDVLHQVGRPGRPGRQAERQGQQRGDDQAAAPHQEHARNETHRRSRGAAVHRLLLSSSEQCSDAPRRQLGNAATAPGKQRPSILNALCSALNTQQIVDREAYSLLKNNLTF